MPKDLLYGELEEGKRPRGRPLQCYRNVCKRDLRDCNIDVTDWETLAEDREAWRNLLEEGLSDFESRMREDGEEKRQKRKERLSVGQHIQSSVFVCNLCGRDCHSRIGLYNHNRKCVVVSATPPPDPIDLGAPPDPIDLGAPLSSHCCPYCRVRFSCQNGL